MNFSAFSYSCSERLYLNEIPSSVSNITILLKESTIVSVYAKAEPGKLSFIATNEKWKIQNDEGLPKWSMRLDDSKEEKADITIKRDGDYRKRPINNYKIQFLNNSNLSHYEYSKRLPKLKFMSDGRVFELNFKTKYNSFFFESLYMKYRNYFEFGRINPKPARRECGLRPQFLINYN